MNFGDQRKESIDSTKKVMQSFKGTKNFTTGIPKQRLGNLKFLFHTVDHRGSKILFREFRWIGFYIIEKIIPNKTYILRKLNSNEMQV